MRIPEIRDELLDLAYKHNLPRLTELANGLYRRQVSPRGKVTSVRVTPEMRAEIKRVREVWPELNQIEIAELFGISLARVSETLSGKRS